MPGVNKNPLRYDPTRTTGMRQAFLRELTALFREFQRNLKDLLITEDAFGLKESNKLRTIEGSIVINTRWSFLTDDAKLARFAEWITSQRSNIEEVAKASTTKYAEEAYKKGVERALKDTKKIAGGIGTPERRAFLQAAFSSPESLNKIQLLASRSYSNLSGITKDMETKLQRIMADAIAQKQSLNEVAETISKQVGLSTNRARTLARTEIIYAHSEGQLDQYERFEEEVQILAEYATAGDDLVCPLCLPLSGIVLDPKKAHGMIPRHPNCRCTWVPADPDTKEKGQKRTNKQVEKAIKASRSADPTRSSGSYGTKAIRSAAQKRKAKLKGKPKTSGNVYAPHVGLFGHSPAGTVRWMGSEGWTFEQAKKALTASGVDIPDKTIRAALNKGKKGTGSKPANITPDQAATLIQRRDGLTLPPPPKPDPVVTPPKPVVTPPKPVVTPDPPTRNFPTPPARKMTRAEKNNADWILIRTTGVDKKGRNWSIYRDSKTGFERHITIDPKTNKEIVKYITPTKQVVPPPKPSPTLPPRKVEPPKPSGGEVPKDLWGHSKAGIVRWLGQEGWSIDEIADFMQNRQITLARSTITTGRAKGKKGINIPSLTDDQMKALRNVKGATVVEPPTVVAKTPTPVPKGVVKPPSHITYSGDVTKATDLQKKVWSKVGELKKGKQPTTEELMDIGKIIREDIQNRPQFVGLKDQIKSAQDELEALKKLPDFYEWRSSKPNDWDDKRWNDYVKLRDRRTHLTKEVSSLSTQHDDEYARAFQEAVTQMRDFGGKFKTRITSAEFENPIQKALNFAHERLPADWNAAVEKRTSGYTITKVKRGYHNFQRKIIAVSGNNAESMSSTMVHEFVHAMENTVSTNGAHTSLARAGKEFRDFRVARSPKANQKKITTIYRGTDEVGYKDEFSNHYTGRVYSQSISTEVMSTGIENFWFRKAGYGVFKESDTTFLDFIVGSLVSL